MGLDMSLFRKRYLYTNDLWSEDVRESITLTKGGVPVPLIKPTYLIEEVLYWRKANHIHRWFVTHIQNGVDDCRQYPVSIQQLTELRDLCNEVLTHKERAASLLPPQSGFFFGSTEIDTYYFEDLTHTVEELNVLLTDPLVTEYYFYYRSSW